MINEIALSVRATFSSLSFRRVFKSANIRVIMLPMLSFVKDIVSEYDLAYYNQETILGGSEIGVSSYPSFNSPYEVGDAFVDAGFNFSLQNYYNYQQLIHQS